MNDDTRAAMADLAVVGLAAIAAYFVAKNAPLRRAVWRALKYGALTAGPRLLWHETTRAWNDSQIPESGLGNRPIGIENQNLDQEPRIANLESRIMTE